MLPASYVTAWGTAALYVEFYLGMCRALATPWLSPWVADNRPGARSCPPAERRTPIETSAAGSIPAAAEDTPRPHSGGARIIPFDQARARLAARR